MLHTLGGVDVELKVHFLGSLTSNQHCYVLQCRGYYKCSAKECKAKKMVQPTDKDPSMFEVTYVGKHTCSSTSQRKSRSRAAAHQAPAAPAPAAAPIDLQKGETQGGTSSI